MMKFNIKILIFLFTCLKFTTAYAQVSADSAARDNAIKATNFSVPSSVAFTLLDVNPSQVNRPGFSKDFKFDWLVKDNKIVSNLAVETQPLWLFFYKNTSYQDLIKKKWFGKMLSSLSVSVGTSSKDSIHSLAWGAKVNLYSAKNPIYNEEYIKKIGQFFTNTPLENEYYRLKTKCRLETDEAAKNECQSQLDSLGKLYQKELEVYLKSQDGYIEQYEKDNWNSTIIDLGFGKVYNYLSESIDSLTFSNQGGGVWISGNFGIGKKILINGMVKYSEIRKNSFTTIGANFRYGGLNANFFIEGLYNATNNDNLNKITIAYGGDIRFKTFALQFGLRTDYTNDFNLKNLVPVVNFNYLLK